MWLIAWTYKSIIFLARRLVADMLMDMKLFQSYPFSCVFNSLAVGRVHMALVCKFYKDERPGFEP